MPSTPIWNWQQKDWPEFRYDSAKLKALESLSQPTQLNAQALKN